MPVHIPDVPPAMTAAQVATMERQRQIQPRCAQCQGDYIRLEGRLFCGNCGVPEDQKFAPRQIHGTMLSESQRLFHENESLRAENDSLRVRLKKDEPPAVNAEPTAPPKVEAALGTTPFVTASAAEINRAADAIEKPRKGK